MSVRCKMRVEGVAETKDDAGVKTQERVTLRAVYSEDKTQENYQWSRWTPAAEFTLHISNPGAFGKLPQGQEFFVDITPVAAAFPCPNCDTTEKQAGERFDKAPKAV